MLSGQQYQLASGQHPAGHEVSSDPHCLLAAILVSFSLMATKGQSAIILHTAETISRKSINNGGNNLIGQELVNTAHDSRCTLVTSHCPCFHVSAHPLGTWVPISRPHDL